MDFMTYQKATAETWITQDTNLEDACHAAFGLLAEAGEVAALFQKSFRAGKQDAIGAAVLGKELGDVLYYLTRLAHEYGLLMDNIALENLSKLADRKKRKVIEGSGDDR